MGFLQMVKLVKDIIKDEFDNLCVFKCTGHLDTLFNGLQEAILLMLSESRWIELFDILQLPV